MVMTVLLFASLRDAAGADSVTIAVGADEGRATVRDLVNACALQFPALAAWLPHIRIAVNCEYVGGETLVSPADEIAFIPPVSGGCLS